MKHFPDRAVQEIVDGFEAAQRILRFIVDGQPVLNNAAIGAELRVIPHAEERIRTLRLSRYLRPSSQETPCSQN